MDEHAFPPMDFAEHCYLPQLPFTGMSKIICVCRARKRRKDSRLILLYNGLKGKARIPMDDLIPKTRRCRNHHSLAFQIPSASKDAYKYSFFPQTIRNWNNLPESLFSSAEMMIVSKFASLVRARD